VSAGAVTHIAGLVIDVGPLMRQRCAWCGAVLVDYDRERVMVQADRPADRELPSWPVGELVEVDGPVSTVVEHEAGVDKLPANACARLDPEVTA
jgi:hypothetical protein